MRSNLLKIFNRITHTQFIAFLVVLALAMAWHRYFILDDAYISFRYAQFLSQGHGLVWYPGSTEFGYTNFLFTTLVGALLAVGLPAETGAALITIPSFVMAMVLLYRLASHLNCNMWVARALAVIATTHFTLSSYASSGLETSLQMMLILGFYSLCFTDSTKRNMHAIGTIAAFAMLCRLDSALLLLPGYVWLAFFQLQERQFLPLIRVVAIPSATIGLFLIGCYVFYGYALPNTFYAKLDLHRSFHNAGITYLFTYMRAEAYIPLMLALFFVGGAARNHFRHIDSKEVCLLGVLFIWLAYIIYAGGDFMEFRLLVPVIPVFLLLTFQSAQYITRSKMHYLAAILLCTGLWANYSHATQFRATGLVADIAHFKETMENPRHNWRMAGKALGELFYTGNANDVKIAVHTAGAIPYFSMLPTIDKYGLNDRWVAMNGHPGSRIPGHRRVAPHSYFERQEVNIVFPGLPQYRCPERANRPLPKYHGLARLLLPLSSDCYVIGYYLFPHPKIDSAIADGRIRMVPHK
ncbi:MAG: hypothetical protein ACN2B6_03935 [Rickettsiales bacterium]